MARRRSSLSRVLRRSRRHYLLLILLLLTFSPSLIALYFVVSSKNEKVVTSALSQSWSQDETESLTLKCQDSSAGPCCARWEIDTDDWWVEHPDWEVTQNNATHTCYSLIQNEQQAAFLRSVYRLQWKTDCSKAVQKQQISSGYAAALMSTARSFYAAFLENKPFQITKRHENANWNFSPRNSSHWAYCKTEDMNCYYLPLSPCVPEFGRDDATRGTKPTAAKARREFLWLRQYAFRQRQRLRKHLWDFTAQHVPTSMQTPCTAIHVRRGDIAFGRGRRYAPVEEYLATGNITKGATVVLLSDDASTIDEVERYHKKDYHWVYLNRPRFHGAAGGFEGFIPSQDPAFEIMAILAEVRLAGQCNKLVYGKSGFVAVIADEMESSGKPFEMVYLQTQQNKLEQSKMDPKQRAEIYLKAIQQKLQDKRVA